MCMNEYPIDRLLLLLCGFCMLYYNSPQAICHCFCTQQSLVLD